MIYGRLSVITASNNILIIDGNVGKGTACDYNADVCWMFGGGRLMMLMWSATNADYVVHDACWRYARLILWVMEMDYGRWVVRDG